MGHGINTMQTSRSFYWKTPLIRSLTKNDTKYNKSKLRIFPQLDDPGTVALQLPADTARQGGGGAVVAGAVGRVDVLVPRLPRLLRVEVAVDLLQHRGGDWDTEPGVQRAHHLQYRTVMFCRPPCIPDVGQPPSPRTSPAGTARRTAGSRAPGLL